MFRKGIRIHYVLLRYRNLTYSTSRGKEKAGAKQSQGLKTEKLNKTILAYPTRLYNLVEHIEGRAVKY
jgi:hypothetical protein